MQRRDRYRARTAGSLAGQLGCGALQRCPRCDRERSRSHCGAIDVHRAGADGRHGLSKVAGKRNVAADCCRNRG